MACQACSTYLAHLIIVNDQHVNRFNGEETLIHSGTLGWIGAEDVRCDHSCKVVRIHLASDLIIDLRKRGSPVEEAKKNLRRISMALWQKAACQVQNPDTLFLFSEFYEKLASTYKTFQDTYSAKH